MAKQKPTGYWRNLDNVKSHIDELVAELGGKTPITSDFNRLGQSSLLRAICSYHGGLNETLISCGYEPNRNPNGKWDDFENVLAYLKQTKVELGRYPTLTELSSNQSVLYNTIKKKHGGLKHVISKIDPNYSGKITRIPSTHWQDWNNVEKELLKIIRANDGKFPSSTYLSSNRLNSILIGIKKYHGNLSTVKEKKIIWSQQLINI